LLGGVEQPELEEILRPILPEERQGESKAPREYLLTASGISFERNLVDLWPDVGFVQVLRRARESNAAVAMLPVIVGLLPVVHPICPPSPA